MTSGHTAETFDMMLTSTFDAVLSKTYRDPGAIAEHLAHYRRYIELLFAQ